MINWGTREIESDAEKRAYKDNLRHGPPDSSALVERCIYCKRWVSEAETATADCCTRPECIEQRISEDRQLAAESEVEREQLDWERDLYLP